MQLGNRVKKENEISLGTTAGSFGAFHQWGTFVRKINQCRISTSAWNQSEENNFVFFKDGIRKRQTHSRRIFKGVEASIEIPLSTNTQLEISVWSQASQREIAPSLFESSSVAQQDDENHRILVQGSGKTFQWDWKLSSGLSFDRLLYTDPKSGIFSNSRIYQNLNWFEASRQKGNFNFKLEGLLSSAVVQSSAYSQKTSLNRLSANGTISYRFETIPFEIISSLKADHVRYGQNRTPGSCFLPSVSGIWTEPVWGEFQAGWHRKCRFPTLNDLFWPLSGNADLIPENGYTADFAWKKSQKLRSGFSLECKLNIYQTSVRNYIQWLPSGNFWTPSNVGNVRIQGMNLAPGIRFHHAKADITLGYDAGVCRSEFTGNRFPGDHSKGKQLIYIPVFQSQLSLGVRIKQFDMNVSAERTGQRNTDPSGQHVLSGFTLLNARIGSTFEVAKSSKFKLFLEGRNLTNSTYQMVVGYPMPLRQFTVGIELQFK